MRNLRGVGGGFGLREVLRRALALALGGPDGLLGLAQGGAGLLDALLGGAFALGSGGLALGLSGALGLEPLGLEPLGFGGLRGRPLGVLLARSRSLPLI